MEEEKKVYPYEGHIFVQDPKCSNAFCFICGGRKKHHKLICIKAVDAFKWVALFMENGELKREYE